MARENNILLNNMNRENHIEQLEIGGGDNDSDDIQEETIKNVISTKGKFASFLYVQNEQNQQTTYRRSFIEPLNKKGSFTATGNNIALVKILLNLEKGFVCLDK